ncbi:MMPL family transporter [Bailinhaonella thermotolerans]|uniref:MMPL family transporter n=1 Tax=Bailinhaonella thermotolerans TaxID=1070861 RepID=UPI00192A61ED|nr:MMPL family transporter [Bailinhaonella thermotolerans]
MLPESKPIIERVVGWSVRHRAPAIGGWFTLVIGALLLGGVLGLDQRNSTDPGESGRADRILTARDAYIPPHENILIQPRTGTTRFASDPAARAATQDLAAALRGHGTLRSPLDRDGADLISQDGRSGLVTIQVAGPREAIAGHYAAIAKGVLEVSARHPDVRLAQAGDRSLARAVDEGITGDMKRAEFFSLPLTVLILLVVFGSLIAAGIPLLLAVTTVAGTFGLLEVVGHWIPINSAASSIVLLIGIAVGIDYSLFYLRRVREERAAGASTADALRTSARTSGHVVVVSGVTVMLCLSGLLFTGLDNFKGLAAGAVLVVGLAMIGSVTVLPALLALLGRNIDRARLPWIGRRRTRPEQSRFWTTVARHVVRRPALWGGRPRSP